MLKYVFMYVKIYKSRKTSFYQTFAMFWILYAFFWVIPWRLNFICRRFGTLCLFHLHTKWSVVGWSVAKCCSVVMVLVIRCPTLLENIQTIWICCLYVFCYYHILYVLFFINLYLFISVSYVFLLLYLCILIVCLCIFIVPTVILRLPWLRFFRAFPSVVRQMPG
jgi:hypothetical protein